MKNHKQSLRSNDLKSLIVNRQSNTPIQYIKGYVEWYKLKLKVTPAVLIPRPETELLIDEVLKFVNRKSSIINRYTILDLGTGTGNIAIALAKNLNVHTRSVNTNIKIIAIDISEKALKVARQNAKLHGVLDKITFIQSDLLEPVIPVNTGIQRALARKLRLLIKTSGTKKSNKLLDSRLRGNDTLIVVTNLPYIPSSRIPHLDSSVKDYEPHLALDGGEDGFDLYRKLFQQIKDQHLKVDFLLGEIDYTQGEIAQTEAKKYFPEAKVAVKKDLAGRERLLLIQQP